ncbi:MAG: extracellular solute-binding protein [Thermaceae bacterium]|nr:extracellular solute-binding protein [Thermaceae bacterium]
MARLGINGLKVGILAIAMLSGALAQTLTFWSWRVEDKEFYEDIARQFEAKTGIKVVYTPYKNTEYNTILASALAAGSGPDIIHTRAYGGLAQLADAGYLLPIDAKQVPGLSKFPSSLLNAARGFKDDTKKKIYGVPFATQSLGFFYNKDLLAKAGITRLPETWPDFKAALAKIKAAGIIPLANGPKDGVSLEQIFGVIGPMFYGGTDYFRELTAGQKTFVDDGFIKALEETAALKEFFPPNYAGIGYPEGRTLFTNGGAAFFVTGGFDIAYFRDNNPKLNFGFMPAPPLTRGGRTYVPTFADGNFSINAKSKNIEAALKFLSFLATPEFGQQFTEKLAQASAVPGTKAKDPVLQQIMEQTGYYGTPFLTLVGFRYAAPTGTELLRSGLQRMILGQATGRQVAEEMTKGVATWYKPFQK